MTNGRSVVAVLALLAWPAVAQEASPPNIRFASALAERRWDGLAEGYILRLLADGETPDDQRSSLAGELSALLARRAAVADDDAAAATWDRLDAVLGDAVEQSKDEGSRFRLRLQRATTVLARGRVEWERASLQSFDGRPPAEAATAAAARLRQAADSLNALDADLATAAGRGKPRGSVGDRAKAAEAAELLADVRRRRAEADAAFAETVGDDSQQGVAALRRADALLTPPAEPNGKTPIDPDDALRSIEIRRRLADFGGATDRLDRLAEAAGVDPPMGVAPERLLTERVELLLAQEKILDALAALHAAGTDRPAPPERQYLYVRVLLEQASQMKGDAERAAKLQAAAFRELRRLEAVGGPWLRRGEQLLTRFADGLVSGEAAD
ncbi:MAG: hypothetical protein ACRDD1_06200, partial [Planctomycetia bacterium]